MTHNVEHFTDNWINDQLDLLNLATSLGDTGWQQQIIQALHNKESIIKTEMDAVARQKLWDKFDAINERMISIYRQIRENRNQREQQSLREVALELKRERVKIGMKLRVQHLQEK